MSFVLVAAGIGAAAAVGSAAIGAHQQKQASKHNRNEANRLGKEIKRLETKRSLELPVILSLIHI